MKRHPLSADQIRAGFKQRGETISEWSLRHGYPRKAVYRVLAGVEKAWYGRAHEIAVALGMKLPADESSESGDVGNTQSRQAG